MKLLGLLVVLLAGLCAAFLMPTPPKIAVDPRNAAVTMQEGVFYDADLDNPDVANDPDAQPARKCGFCMG